MIKTRRNSWKIQKEKEEEEEEEEDDDDDDDDEVNGGYLGSTH